MRRRNGGNPCTCWSKRRCQCGAPGKGWRRGGCALRERQENLRVALRHDEQSQHTAFRERSCTQPCAIAEPRYGIPSSEDLRPCYATKMHMRAILSAMYSADGFGTLPGHGTVTAETAAPRALGARSAACRRKKDAEHGNAERASGLIFASPARGESPRLSFLMGRKRPNRKDKAA